MLLVRSILGVLRVEIDSGFVCKKFGMKSAMSLGIRIPRVAKVP